MTVKWRKRFLEQALLLSTWSKYPGHKVGCVIYDDDKNQLSGGFNGFPRNIKDDGRLQVREKAIKMVVHAEANAIATGARNGHSLKGGSLYSTHRSCSQCAALIIQAGIKAVISIWGQKELSSSGVDWKPEFDFGTEMLMEAGVKVSQLDMETLVLWQPYYDHRHEASPLSWRGLDQDGKVLLPTSSGHGTV